MKPSDISSLAARAGREHAWQTVAAGARRDVVQATALLESNDILALGAMADFARARVVGDEVYFICNRHINHTNVCRNRCLFCAFSHDEGDADAYTLSIDEVVDKARETLAAGGITEIHIVGGEHPDLPFAYYLEMMRALKELAPDVHIQAFTASEIAHFAKISDKSVDEVLAELKLAGLGSLPGGGAEIFAARVRGLIAPGKEPAEEWFHVHDTAHKMGIPTHCTLLYGHVETYEERVDHMLRLRAQQDETGGFLAFIPLAFHPENTVFERRGFRFTTGADDLKMIAVSRLLLDNIPNIKAYWIMMGLPMAQLALHFGANDVQGTVVREQIFQAAGATSGTEQKVSELVRFIKDAGRAPVQRDTLYNELCRW